MKRLPKVAKTGSDNRTVRQYIQEKIDANKIPEHLSDYLCERDVYTPANYDIIRSKFADYIDENTGKINASCCTHNKSAFESFFNDTLRLTNDWTSARMVIHCCLQTFSMGGMVDVFSWADDIMIDQLHSSTTTNR